MKIVQSRSSGVSISYSRRFTNIDCRGSGFGFPCDSQGNVGELNPEARKNYLACLTGEVNGERVRDEGIEELSHRWVSAAIGQCDACKRHIQLEGSTNTCKCGADYNSFGQRLAPREQWGEETGETLADLVNL